MKKKIAVLAITVLALAMFVPMVGLAYAGKGQEKLSFVLTLNGGITGLENPPRETDGITHYDGMLWDTTDNTPANLLLEIDGDPIDIVDYTFRGDMALTKTGISTMHAIDTIFFEDGSTIVLKVQDHIPTYEGTINGYGTDNLEGVKVTGTTLGDGEGNFVRSGIIMGWPT